MDPSSMVVPNHLPGTIPNGRSPLHLAPVYDFEDSVSMSDDAECEDDLSIPNPQTPGLSSTFQPQHTDHPSPLPPDDFDVEMSSGPSSEDDNADQYEDEDENEGREEQEEEDASNSDHDGADFTQEVESDAPPSEIRSASSDSKRGVKRKSPVDEDEYIRNNPSLYGLRRSGRARHTRPIGPQTSDSDSDVAPRPKRRRPARFSDRVSPVQTPKSPSGSESDLYEGPRRSRKRRRAPRPEDDFAPAHGEVRFSTRRGNKVFNYNEESDDGLFDDDSENIASTEWAIAVDDATPAIDKILDHRFIEGTDLSKLDLGRHDCEFYIKWQDKSHYHATWETSDSLSQCRGVRRLDNYVRREVEQEILFMRDPYVAPEEREKWNLDRERYLEKIEHYKQVERVIGAREAEDGGTTEYYVKWKRLPYDGCTWEDADLISTLAQAEIDAYLDRCSHPPISSKSESNPATRAKFEPIHGQPDFIQNGQLKEFQVKGVNFLAYNWVRGRNVILADEMGLGKTVQTVAFINWLRRARQQQGPFLVVVPLSTMPAWGETFEYWTPDVNYVVYSGPEPARRIIKDYELLMDGNLKRPKFHVLLTTYEYVLQDAHFLSQIKWQFMAVDEAHRLKNRESQLYQKLDEFKAPCRLLITGTPVQNNLGELSALMDFLNPGMVDIDENMDLNSEAASSKLAELTQAIQPYMLRRTKSKVESELPPKSEKIIRVELSDVQLELYKNILTKNYDALNHGGRGPKPSLLNIVMELKKASNHPFMFWSIDNQINEGTMRREDTLKSLVTSSGKMMVLDQLLNKLKNDGHRVLIFSQMVKMLNILADYMDARGFTYQRLDGTIAAGPRRLAIEHYNAPGSTDFAFLLSTRAGGLGINLMTADTVILFDSDWNPQADLQAMARAHRIGQTRPVSVYRFVSKDTVEEEVLERARNKLLLEFITIQRGVTDNEASSLKNKMTKAGHHMGEPTSFDDISRILKQRGQRMFEQPSNQKRLEELDIDAVLANAEEHNTVEEEAIEVSGGIDFINECQYVDVKFDDLTWDDIIPKEYLEKVKAEEQEAEARKQKEEVEESEAPLVNAHDERGERKAKRRARQQVNMDVDGLSDEAAGPDPFQPLNDKEYRHLIRSYLRFGDINEREDDIVKEARLTNRDRGMVKQALQEVIDKARILEQEECERIRALEHEGKIFTKKERKAVLFDHKGVKRLNAETLVGRAEEMRMLQKITANLADPKSFRVPEATKGADYTCPWGAREDGMLCIGIARHGYGAWTQIRDDADLGLEDKFFLEEHRVDRKNERLNGKGEGSKSPGAVHLVRRADYLLSVLKVKASNGSSVAAKKALENHHRNNKKGVTHGRHPSRTSISASPVPSLPRKGRELEISRRRMANRGRDSIEGSQTPLKDSRKHRSNSDKKGSRDEGKKRRQSDDRTLTVPHGGDNMLKIVFKPIRDQLRKVSNVTKETFPIKTERAAELRRLLRMIGDFISKTLEGEEARSTLELRLWSYCASYWPNKDTPGSALLNMYGRLVAAENGVQATN